MVAGGGAVAKSVFAAVGKFFRETAEDLRTPFQDLHLGGPELALPGGGSVPSRRFGQEMRQWQKDAGRREEGIAYAKRLPSSNSKKNTGGGIFGSKKDAEKAAREAVSHGGRARYRDECAKGDHVHAEFLNKHGEVSETRHFGWRKKK
ncbi:hypothetical protein GCM10023191_059660 [Actinoallomurus oryzae]|jgi:hypothetical protein|uniref:Uncharacterized protein n=1 Tax=Actinoallomurus oryzae TaxID=502180 RepID=A0ABP8QK51_9ACTN